MKIEQRVIKIQEDGYALLQNSNDEFITCPYGFVSIGKIMDKAACTLNCAALAIKELETNGGDGTGVISAKCLAGNFVMGIFCKEAKENFEID